MMFMSNDEEIIANEKVPPADLRKGALAWMAGNSVAANLLMFMLLLGGVLGLIFTKQEVFPEFSLDTVTVTVAYPGASPSEVEQGIALAVEERVRGLDGVKHVRSSSGENVGTVTIELLRGANPETVLADVKNEIDRIATFPEESEKPVVSLAKNRRQVVSLILSGDQELQVLNDLAEKARGALLEREGITQVEIEGVAPMEISIEVSRETLDRYGLTLEKIAQEISRSSIDLAAGGIDTRNGEVLLRVADRRKAGHELESIIVRGSKVGGEVRLGDIATISDGFEDQDRFSYFNGKPAIRLTAYRVGDETPTAVSATVRDFANELRQQLPPEISVNIWNDDSEGLRDRISLLGRNAVAGFFLVLVTLALFLDLRLALWVALGIPTSFLGSFLVLGTSDLSINMITLFAFIVTLGMVVDDAIVVGERAYSLAEEGYRPIDAAIMAAKEMLVPITFAILTSIAAFAPMLFVPGTMGKIFRMIPVIVISVLSISLLESFLILPAHLSHRRHGGASKYVVFRAIEHLQAQVSRGLAWFSLRIYRPTVQKIIVYRYIALALALALLIATAGAVKAGLVPFNFFPELEGDVIRAQATLPYGAAIESTREVQREIERALATTIDDFGGESAVRGSFTRLGEGSATGGPGGGAGAKGSHLVSVEVALLPSHERSFGAEAFALAWRQSLPEMPQVESIKISSAAGPGAGAPVAIQLIHPDHERLAEISIETEKILREYTELKNVKNEHSSGKSQVSFHLLPDARSLGVSAGDVASQLRSAFFGAEAIREQRGRNELRIVARLPKDERRSEHDLESMMIRTANGSRVPLHYVASLERGRAATTILREDGQRTITVSGELAEGVPSAQGVLNDLNTRVFPELKAKYPRLEVELVGAQREQADAFKALGVGLIVAIFSIYALLAIPFRSYVQPIIIMTVIPFGVVGAVAGHVIEGYSLSIMSMFGIIALSGVVVNDSIVLIDAVNRLRSEGWEKFEAVVEGGFTRIRPILLTSLTTYFGLAPMISETSVQAKFLIPMALSLGYGILFSTVTVLFLVPAIYIIVEDMRSGWRRLVSIVAGDSH
jgi:multidrug efflux pump subunit AcrB